MYQTVFNISEEEFSVLHYYGMWSVVHFYVVITKESVVWCTDFKPNKKCFFVCLYISVGECQRHVGPAVKSHFPAAWSVMRNVFSF